MASTLQFYEMKKIIFYFFLSLVITSCSNDNLDQYKLPEIQPSQSLINALRSSRQTLNKTNSKKNSTFKIQFHGQSIVYSIKSSRVETTLEGDFSDIDFEIINTARSGLQVPQLLPLIEEDIDGNSDVLFFHAYGGTEAGELIQYFEYLKENFNGDVIIFNHHLSAPDDPAHNLKLTELENKTSAQMEEIASNYNFGFIDVRNDWRRFLELNKEIQPKDILRDGVHPNEDGRLLLEWILMEHFTKAINLN